MLGDESCWKEEANRLQAAAAAAPFSSKYVYAKQMAKELKTHSNSEPGIRKGWWPKGAPSVSVQNGIT